MLNKVKLIDELKYFLYIYFFVVVILLCLYSLFLKDNSDFLVMITFLVIGLISAYNLVMSYNVPFSLNQIHWLFIFIFLFLAPFFQYINNIFPWNTYASTSDYIYINILIIIWCVFYSIGYKLLRVKKNYFSNTELKKKHKIILSINKYNIKVNMFFSIVIFVIYMYLFGITAFNTRFSFSNKVSSLGIDNPLLQIVLLLRLIPVLTLGGLLVKGEIFKKDNKYTYVIYTAVIIVINLFINNPFAIPRFLLGSILIGFFVILLKNKLKNSWYFTIIFFIGLLIVFPVINVFRRITLNQFDYNLIRQIDVLNNFLNGDFDSYSIIIRTVNYVRNNSITYGRQLLGVLFVFVPREFWPTKPFASGQLIAIEQGLLYTNLSCPIVAEAYINLGVIGIIIFSITVSLLIKKIDCLYWQSKYKSDIFELIYPFLLGLTFFNMRGSLLSTFTSIIAFFVSACVFMIVNLLIWKK